MRKALYSVLFVAALLLPQLSFAQGGRANAVPAGAKPNPPSQASKPLDQQQKFAYDVVRTAVSLPQGDPQDRLRVLAAASSVIAPIRPSMARQFSREGLRVEQELIQRGEQPVTSMLDAGPVDCRAVQMLVEGIDPKRVASAEPTLVGAVSRCPATAVSVRRLIDAGLDEKVLAPRATLALMDKLGVSSAWSQQKFEQLFNSLPSNTAGIEQQAPSLASLYARAAGDMDREQAKTSGLRLLAWLGKLDASGDRTVAINVASGAMKQVLGDKAYQEAMASDMMARQTAESAGGKGEISQPQEQTVSVLLAMQAPAQDRLQQLQQMPAPQRAREAAASGFGAGSSGDRKLAAQYFDIAFSALDGVWRDRQSIRNAASVVQEVSDAAAQVDPLDALRRTRALDDSAAQAIGMISVARVEAGKQGTETTSASR